MPPLEPPTSPDPATPHLIRLKDGITESDGPNGPKATVVYHCRWEDRYSLRNDLLGGYPSGATGFVLHTLPHRYPPSPNMFCTEVAIGGLGARKTGGSKWLPYVLAEVAATYEIPRYDLDTPTEAGQIDPANPILFCRQRIRGSSGFVVLPEQKLKFSSSGKIVDSEVGRPVAQSEITLEFPRVNFNPYQSVRPYLGRTNATTMFGHPPGHIYFDSIDTDDSATSGGIDHAVTLTFLGRDSDWNTLINENGSYELVHYDISPAPPEPVRPFQRIDLFEMFT
jgi:hypothetical protein